MRQSPQGDLLFQIDPRPFEAALAQAQGTLAKDKANQVKADADEKRALDEIQKLTDDEIKKMEEMSKAKEKEVLEFK